MNMNKKTLILAGVLAVLIALAYAYQGPIKTWRDNLSKPKNFLAGLNSIKLDKIVVGGKNGETTLVRQGEDWLVWGTEFKVAKAVMEEALSALDRAGRAELEFASTNKDKKKDFRTDSSGVILKLYAGGEEIKTAVIGKVAADYQSSYISEPQIDSTYLLKGINLSYIFDKEEWRDRTIFASDSAKLNKVRFQFPDRRFTIVKTGEKWFIEGQGKTELNQEKVDKILGLMANLSASSIPVQDFKPTGLDKNQMIVEATGDSIKNILMVGNDNGKGGFYAKRGDSDDIYLISKTDRDALNVKPEQLK